MDHRGVTKKAFEKFLEYLPNKGGKVLDVGCGGDPYREFLEHHGYEWFGCDQKYVGRVEDVKICKMEDLHHYGEEEFDLVFASHSFEHCERPIDALEEFRRVLKPNGFVFLSTPPMCKEQIFADNDHIFVLDLDQLKKLLTYTGFEYINGFREENPSLGSNTDSLITIGKKVEA